MTVPLNFTRFLKTETDSVVWWTAISELSALQAALILSPAYGRFQTYYSSLIEKLTANLGWVEKSEDKQLWHVRALVRAQALGLAVNLRDSSTIEFALKQFALIKEGKPDESLPIDVIGIIYQAAAEWGTEGNFIWEFTRL